MPARDTLLILTHNSDQHAVRRLLEAGNALPGAQALWLDPNLLELSVAAGAPQLRCAPQAAQPGSELPALDRCAVIPRLGSLSPEYSLTALEALELAGVPALNSSGAIHRLRNKFTALARLSAAGVPVPQSVLLRSPADCGPAVERLGGFPLILKFLRGTHGLGVILAENMSTVRSVLDALNLVHYDVLLQRHYPEAAAGDIRVLVLAGRARCAMRRISAEGQFRSNLHRGASALPLELTDAQRAVAEAACAAIGGLGLAGIDMFEAADGLRVLEVNSSPGFEGLEAATGQDIATQIAVAALDLPA